MKTRLLFLALITTMSFATRAQVVNQITLIPSNPTPTDTIRVVSDFTYYGNCSFGLVYEQSWP